MVQYLPDPNFIPILFFFFPLFGSFFPLFCPPLTFPLPSFFFSFSYSFPIPFLPFYFPFLLLFFLSFLPFFISPTALPLCLPHPPLLLQKILGRTLGIAANAKVIFPFLKHMYIHWEGTSESGRWVVPPVIKVRVVPPVIKMVGKYVPSPPPLLLSRLNIHNQRCAV